MRWLDEERTALGRRDAGPGLLARLAGFLVGAIVLVAAFAFSLVLFAALLVIGAMVWGYVWWRTRDLRRQMAAQMAEQMAEQRREQRPGGRVIEGEVVHRPPPDPRERR